MNSRNFPLKIEVTKWPPRNADLTPMNLFLWRYPKLRVFSSNPGCIIQFKENIREEMAAIMETTYFAMLKILFLV